MWRGLAIGHLLPEWINKDFISYRIAQVVSPPLLTKDALI
jgi:hypothetical protein